MNSDVEVYLKRARIAQQAIAHWDQELVDNMVRAVAWQSYAPANVGLLSDLAYEETGLGDPVDLFALHRQRVIGTLHDLEDVQTIGPIETRLAEGLVKFAKPVGVIAAATPATAPCSGITCNALQMIKTRNAVIFSPNPRSQAAAIKTVEILRIGLEAAGAPPDLLQCLTPSTRQRSSELMKGVDLVVASGGPGTVERAYTSGTPAIGAGVGNPSVIVDETADLQAAASMTAAGAGYNNGTSCSSESNVLVAEAVVAEFRELLSECDAHICSSVESEQVSKLLWPEGTVLNRDAVGQPAPVLAQMAGFHVDVSCRVLVVQATDSSIENPVFTEKLAPVLTLVPFQDFAEAIQIVKTIGDKSGRGHSCGIHSSDESRINEVARHVEFCRLIVNQSTAFANSGSLGNGLPFTSVVASGTWGGCAQSENITWRHFLNYTWVSRPITPTEPVEDQIFGKWWQSEAYAELEEVAIADTDRERKVAPS